MPKFLKSHKVSLLNIHTNIMIWSVNMSAQSRSIRWHSISAWRSCILPCGDDADVPLGLASRFHLQGGEHQHLLLGAVDLLQQDGPAGLFVQLGDSDGVVLKHKHLSATERWFWVFRWKTALLWGSDRRRRCTWSAAAAGRCSECPAPWGNATSPATCQPQRR